MGLINVERGKQSGGPVALVVMGHRPATAFFHRKPGLRSIQGVNLGLFIHTQHKRLVRGG